MKVYIKEIQLPSDHNKNEKINKVNTIFMAENGMQFCLSWQLKIHYNAYTYEYWKKFVDTYIDSINNVVISYMYGKENKINILGITILIEDISKRNVYVRCICSKCHTGGIMMKYIINKYNNDKLYDYMYLHSEPDSYVLRFYKKHGFLMLKEYNIDEYGIRYPKMLLPLNTNYSIDTTNIKTDFFFPGLMYYVIKLFTQIKSLF